MNQYQQIREQSKKLGEKMRMGSGVSNLLQSRDAATHYADALQRFQKDFASLERAKRDEDKVKKQEDIEKRRLDYLERENKRWELVQQKYAKERQREQLKIQEQVLGVRRSANSNGLAYNPINLSYDSNPQGQKLKTRDEDAQIRRFVRAHNMDHRGNSAFNPLNGGSRVGIEQVIPRQLSNRYQQKLHNHYEELRIRVPPHSSSTERNSPRNYYQKM